ncbi:MAG: acyl-CoA dehydrogenase family protein [Alphaproteobacteria bacterium]|nr:acyl-CoA dehydrogenase [Rhodobiaceae bacterium]MBO6541734.1 acyl-CoA dehydrogenase family protein [Alphaproteobacteria bacterium]MBO6628871.1 acyl-CoA dehydrogenase family protein [Alphaproteobacteria bacterium]MDF1625928.1 acyl-CoA dehydrogenase [Parvibaculaceae bacterium]
MNEFRTLIGDTIERLLADHATKEVIQSAEEGVWPKALWQALEENGLTRLMASEANGGGGGTWGDAFVLLTAQGRHAAPVPLAETLVATWLLDGAGLPLPQGPLTLLTGLTLNGDKVSGCARNVPWAEEASHGVAVIGDGPDAQVALVPLADAHKTHALNTAREPRVTCTFDAVKVALGPAAQAGSMELWGALMRACLMAGGLQTLLRDSVTYANERKQFGKPIGKFQAIQQQLAVLATQTAAAVAIANHAADRASETDDVAFEIAVAKTRIDDAVNIATSISHQVHGAIGFTYEHTLHLTTRRLWSWRAEFGSGRDWARHLGREAIERGADALWTYVTAR